MVETVHTIQYISYKMARYSSFSATPLDLLCLIVLETSRRSIKTYCMYECECGLNINSTFCALLHMCSLAIITNSLVTSLHYALS